jgi:hypothetical protein
MDDTDDTDSIDGDDVEENFFSDPFFYDPVLPAGAKVAFDVQGAEGKIIMFVPFYALGCCWCQSLYIFIYILFYIFFMLHTQPSPPFSHVAINR